MSQSGLRGSKMIQNDHYNMFLTIWRHFGPIWTLLNHFRLNLIFLPQITLVKKHFVFLKHKIKFCLKWFKKVPLGPKWHQLVTNMLYWSFWIILDPLRPFWDIGKSAMFGHFWPEKGHFGPPGMIEGCQCPKLLQTNFVYVLALCICDGFPH